MVELILKKDVIGLGEEGDIVRVKDGFARNYLMPFQYAIPKSDNNLKILEKQREAIEKRKEEKRKLDQNLKEKIQTTKIELKRRVVEGTKLYGSVSAKDLVVILNDEGIQVEKHNIEMPGPIKLIGEHTIAIKLSTGEKATLKVNIQAGE
ncbi:MAG TPA: 50S ribosomal protein L9 [Spirochaetia bacterium]|nr:MAG: 50S ribosomal protein L9 [Spirochaetes bacterium GWB1_36_13]HCL55406.1 50S ribosomal protein L9 [Spirochaetia bacterium]